MQNVENSTTPVGRRVPLEQGEADRRKIAPLTNSCLPARSRGLNGTQNFRSGLAAK